MREPSDSRRAARYTVSALVLVLASASLTALATQGRGCAVRPLHGDAVRLTASATVPLTFAGETDDRATAVVIKTGTLGAQSSGAASLTNAQTLHTITSLTPNAAGKKQFSVQLNLARTLWTGRDVVPFQVDERLPDGTQRALATITASGALNIDHALIGVAKLPEPAVLPAQVNGSFTALPGQSANTFLAIAGTPAANDAYYAKFGPLEAFDTFAEWIFLSGFSADGESVAYYRNEQDLGFGRQMHCRVLERDPFNAFARRAACYVVNFADESAASLGRNPAATVAMDFDVRRADKVRFFVYGPDGKRLNKVNLDGGNVEKAVPNLCLNCHGGKLQPDNSVLGAHFLPFDVAYLPTPSDRGPQLEAFRQLNEIVWAVEMQNPSEPSTISPIVDLIDGWYGGLGSVRDPASQFDAAFVPDAWSDHPGTYREVIAPSCRTCHVAQRPAISWSSSGQVFNPATRTLIDARVCQPGSSTGSTPAAFLMPHAQRTFHKFWLSGARAALAVDLGLGKCDFKPLRP